MEPKGFFGGPAPAKEPEAIAGAAVADALIQAAENYADDAEAEGTAEAYRKHWAAFESWCAGEGLGALPAAPQTVASYIALRATKGAGPRRCVSL